MRIRCAPGGTARVAVRHSTRSPRTLDGAPATVQVRHFSNFVGTVVVDRPAAYVVPAGVAAHLARFVGTTVVDRPAAYIVPAAVGKHLAQHGLSVAAAPASADVEVARVAGVGADAGRKILEASSVGRLTIEWRNDKRSVPSDAMVVHTDQPLGAIAVYLCEPESDDGAVENGLVAAPGVGDEFPIWRVRG